MNDAYGVIVDAIIAEFNINLESSWKFISITGSLIFSKRQGCASKGLNYFLANCKIDIHAAWLAVKLKMKILMTV